MTTVEEIRARKAKEEQIARFLIRDYIARHGEAYSQELKKRVPLDLSLAHIWKILRDMEVDRILVSETRNPPFDDCPNVGSQRKYYRLPRWV